MASPSGPSSSRFGTSRADRRRDSAPPESDVDERAYALDNQYRQQDDVHKGIIHPAEDEGNTSHNYRQLFGLRNWLKFGKIVYAVPFANWYRVQVDDGDTDFVACQLTDTCVQPFGLRNTSPLAPNTPVLILKNDTSPHGIILGALPSIVSDSARSHPDWISQGSNGGYRRERYYKDLPKKLKEKAGLVDWSNNRPLDASAIGEWGRFTDLGSGIFIDPLMTFLRTDESCGLWLFYYDRMMRLCANNFDLRTGTSERCQRDDNGEAQDMSGYTAYPFEARGIFTFGHADYRELGSKEVNWESPYGKYEPKDDKQQPFYRLQEYRGYEGQAYMREVLIPPDGKANTSALNCYPDTEPRLGVFREQISMDGGYALASAQSVAITKRILIPIPKRLLPAEDPTGDDLKKSSDAAEDGGYTPENGDDAEEEDGYKFAGLHGDGPDHKIQETPRADDDLPHMLKAAAVQETAAYAFNWKGLHVFAYHKNDYDMPEEDQLAPFTSLQIMPSFGQLAGQMWLDQPSPLEADIDHRYPKARYFENTSGLWFNNDGTITMRDGYGFELRTGGGNAQISAPGDIYLQSGRSTVVYAGDDAIIKANKSVDITASKKDVRVKAEHNCELLAGNGGVGRMLIENKSPGIEHSVTDKKGEDIDTPGIILKCANGEIVNWAGWIYLRTGGGDVIPGDILLDAAQGDRVIRNRAATVFNHLTQEWTACFDDHEKVYSFTAGSCTIPTVLRVRGGEINCSGGFLCSGSITVVNGGVSTDSIPDGHMGYIKPGTPPHQALLDAIAAELEIMEEDNPERDKADHDANIVERWYNSNRAGNDTVIEQTMFAPRTAEQMLTEDWKIPENYWQQLANQGAGMPKWSEPIIVYQGIEMMPHPGKQKWAEDTSFWRTQEKLHQIFRGIDEPRGRDGGPYVDPDLLPWDRQVPEGTYEIVTSD